MRAVGVSYASPARMPADHARALVLKDLRYYARFVVVCILTGRRSVLHTLSWAASLRVNLFGLH